MTEKKTFAKKMADLSASLDKTGKSMRNAGNQGMATGCGCMIASAVLLIPLLVILVAIGGR